MARRPWLDVDPLKTCLLDLWHRLGDASQSVLLGGGYGLYLKQRHLAASDIQTLVPADLWPEPRATQDLDLLLRIEVVADAASMRRVREVLDAQHYTAVAGSEYLQFERTLSVGRMVKIDLLTAQLDQLRDNSAIRADGRRARPKVVKGAKLHAHPTDGALGLDASGGTVAITGERTGGESISIEVGLPHPFSYLLMKLTAYRDRKDDPEKELGRHHALDAFRIVTMLTEAEFHEVVHRVSEHVDNAQVQSCREVAARDFQSRQADGVRAMRSHALWRNDGQLDVFFDAIREAFSL